jgi:xeroderma pigmentosum group C-complementing protein
LRSLAFARYALERHLRRDEVIYPRLEIGKFRGEPVFGRHSVTHVKSAENWLRSSGRMIRPGAQPLKMGKVRANTLNKRRAVEMATADTSAGTGEDSAMIQGLYAEWQTEPYVPDPVVQARSSCSILMALSLIISKGKIPKNEFGNIDLYVPSMLPIGAAHIPCEAIQLNVHVVLLRPVLRAVKGVAKIARQLGIDYAEAVVGN